MNLDVCGFDIITKDISKPLKPNNGIICEVNHRPDLEIHQKIFYGKPINVAKIWFENYFKTPKDAWIEIKKGKGAINTQKELNKYLKAIPKKIIQKKYKDSNKKITIKKPKHPLFNYLIDKLTYSVEL